MSKGFKDFDNLTEMLGKMIDVSNHNTEQLTKRVDIMQEDLKYLKVHNEELQISQKELQGKLNNTQHTAMTALEKISFRDENEFGTDWLSQKDLGLLYEPVISSHQMGQILKTIGLAMKNKKRTQPLQQTISRGFVRRGYASNYTSWFWYAPKVKDNFKDFLKDKNLYEEFMSISTDNDMREFIKENIEIRRVR